MDKRLKDAEICLDTYLKHGDMDAYYSTFSKAVERGWLEFLGEGKEYNNAAKGRGQVI